MSRKVRLALPELSAGTHVLRGAEARYLARVHRLIAGDAFTTFDVERRLEAEAEIVVVDRETVTCRIGAPGPARAIAERAVTLIQCAGKGAKVGDVIRAATALGAARIVIAVSARSVARPERDARKDERWRTIAIDAARQSERGDLPELDGPTPLAQVLDAFRSEQSHKLCLQPGAELTLASALAQDPARPLTLLIGPEGGLDATELNQAHAAGFLLVRLGPFVLRTELAAVAALGVVLAG
jgi:16S rRNA (uracil1498-N3)-methyltransferase